MGAGAPPSLAEAMNRLWAQYLPQIEERVRVLEQAAASVADGSLTADLCTQATAAGHKLAGVLGTFGLQDGTVLAREVEEIYADGVEKVSAASGRLAEVASMLRMMIATRKS
jgi:HPt (histidine-containing phosphotransfer) domain-containing protein